MFFTAGEPLGVVYRACCDMCGRRQIEPGGVEYWPQGPIAVAREKTLVWSEIQVHVIPLGDDLTLLMFWCQKQGFILVLTGIIDDHPLSSHPALFPATTYALMTRALAPLSPLVPRSRNAHSMPVP